MSSHFPGTNIRALDRGYDAGYIFDYFIARSEDFIVRLCGDRNCLFKGEKKLVSELAKRFKGQYVLNFATKDGRCAKCKISMVGISLPKYPAHALNLVIVNGFGKNPLLLLTNLKSDDKRLCVSITQVYLMRWRIEEYYKFKKQGFGFEKFLVRTLTSIRNLDLLLTVAIGYIGTLSEKVDESMVVMEVVEASKRLYGLAKFTFYAIADGLSEIFSKLYSGVDCFFVKKPPSPKLSLNFFV